jgi:hypothetical protein
MWCSRNQRQILADSADAATFAFFLPHICALYHLSRYLHYALSLGDAADPTSIENPLFIKTPPISVASASASEAITPQLSSLVTLDLFHVFLQVDDIFLGGMSVFRWGR